MSESSRNVALGAFLVGALVIAVVAVLAISGRGFDRQTTNVVMAFDGSVKGLNLGAPVAFRGVNIGQVTDVDLVFHDDDITVTTEVKAQLSDENMSVLGSRHPEAYLESLVQRGLRAQLQIQSLLTGLLYIQLDFHDGKALDLPPVQAGGYQLPTIPTDLERLTKNLESIDIEKLVRDIQLTMSGIYRFINDPGFQALPGQMSEAVITLRETIGTVQTDLHRTTANLDTLIGSANNTVHNINQRLPEMTEAMQHSLDQLDTAMERVTVTVQELNYSLSDDSPTLYRLNEAVEELSGAGRALQNLAESLEEQPESLIRGRKE